MGRRPSQADERYAPEHADAGVVHDRKQCRAQGALLHHPRQRAFAHVVSGKIERGACVPRHPHRFDRRQAVRRQPLPRTQRPQEGCTARTDGIKPRIPAVRRRVRRGDRPAIDQRDREAGMRQCRGQCEPNETCTRDHDVDTLCARRRRCTGHLLRKIRVRWLLRRVPIPCLRRGGTAARPTGTAHWTGGASLAPSTSMT